MNSLPERIQAANTVLAPYAMPHEGTLGRVVSEEPDTTRFPFQRDRDRIIHTRAFRRLKGKTQVFVSGIGDHYRTRLTHTLEVAQISRDMARTLGLNEDLTECIALAHDLGHPPFGHAGEEALDTWMHTQGGHFEHNQQSLRIVSQLEERCSLYTGLNLNEEVLEGLQKHRTPFDGVGTDYRSLSLEAQIVNIADEIAYTGHDTDDGLRAELFTHQEIASVEVIKQALEEAKIHGTSLRSALVHILIADVYQQTEHLLKKHSIHTLDDVYVCSTPLVDFSADTRQRINTLRTFLWDNMYMHPDVSKNAQRGKEIVIALCREFHKNSIPKIEELMAVHSSSHTEAVKDYVAGMTDAFAMQSYGNLKS